MRRFLAVASLILVGIIVSGAVGVNTLLGTERTISIGAHTATASPNFDGHVTILAGPLLPEFQFPTKSRGPIGVTILLLDSPVTDLESVLQQDAAIASQPQGEIAAVTAEIADMVKSSVARGVLAGGMAMLATYLLWRAVGPRRRNELFRISLRRRPVLLAATVAAVLVVTVAVTSMPTLRSSRHVTWVPIRTVFPELPESPMLDEVKVSRGAASSGSRALVQGALDTYRESLEFYNDLADHAAEIEVREPEEDQTVAIVVTDRHDNVGMDPVARAVADVAGASFVIDLGDDTSNGAAWEAFSINSLRESFKDFPIVAVAGNHDQGQHIREVMKSNDFIVLEGEPETVEGVSLIGDSDPRSSGLVAGYSGNESDNIAAIRDQDAELADAACDASDTSVMMVHSAASARETIARACVDLVLSGHLHREVGPQVRNGPDGSLTTWSLASTGGAVYAFALGSKLRREAQVGIVTFEGSKPIGVQGVSFKPGGVIKVGDWTPVIAGPPQDDPADRDDNNPDRLQ